MFRETISDRKCMLSGSNPLRSTNFNRWHNYKKTPHKENKAMNNYSRQHFPRPLLWIDLKRLWKMGMQEIFFCTFSSVRFNQHKAGFDSWLYRFLLKKNQSSCFDPVKFVVKKKQTNYLVVKTSKIKKVFKCTDSGQFFFFLGNFWFCEFVIFDPLFLLIFLLHFSVNYDKNEFV